MLYVVSHQNRLVRNSLGLLEAEEKLAHKNYTACCPEDIAKKLEGRGYGVSRQIRGRQAFLEARLPGGNLGDYRATAKIAFDHAGKRSVRIAPGALRMACYNQFTSANQIRLHHCGADIKRFNERPWEFLEDLLAPAVEMANRIEALRPVISNNLGRRWIHCLLGGYPKLLGKVLPRFSRYSLENRWIPGPWAVLQAFTDTHSPTLERAVGELVTDHYQELAAGIVPEYQLN